MKNKIFCDKLAHYAYHEPKYFLQFDAYYLPNGGDDLLRTDKRGDAITAVPTVELIHGSAVRVLIPYTTDIKVAIRHLKKITKWLKREPELIEYAEPPSTENISRENQDFDDESPF